MDLVSAGRAANVLTVLTNNGSGGFAVATNLATGNAPQAVLSADLNTDGKADLVSANQDGDSLTVILNASTVTEVPRSTSPTASFSGVFSGAYSGNAAGLTNVSPAAISGGLTTNFPVLVPGNKTNTLVFSNGILIRIQ